jgi:predicted dehydrogenase
MGGRAMAEARCRWAIVGTGEVAGKFAIGLRQVPGAELTLIASRSAERASALAAALGAAGSVGGYEAAAAAEVDAVYVATPPSEHRANALLFIEAGKPVLIEKPFALNAEDARAIADAARAAGVFCMEGMWTRFMPAMQAVRDLIAQGRIGEPRSLFASFAVADEVDPGNRFFRPDLGGGASTHRLVYPLSLALDLLGPASLVSAGLTWGRTGIDEDCLASLRHANGALSSLYASARTTADNNLVILGTEGRLRFEGPIYRPFGVRFEAVRSRRRGAPRWSRMAVFKEGPLAQGLRQRLDGLVGLRSQSRRFRAPYIGNGYAHEAMEVMYALDRGWREHPSMSLDASIAVADLLDQIRTVGRAA